MKKMNKLFMVLLCAITVAGTMEARRGGGRGGRGGFHRGGGRGGFHRGGGRGWGHGGGWRGWRGGYWGARPWFGIGLGPTVVVDDSASYAPRRPASLDTFISEFGRNPYNVNEFCRWVNSTGRSQRQCDLYRAYRGY